MIDPCPPSHSCCRAATPEMCSLLSQIRVIPYVPTYGDRLMQLQAEHTFQSTDNTNKTSRLPTLFISHRSTLLTTSSFRALQPCRSTLSNQLSFTCRLHLIREEAKTKRRWLPSTPFVISTSPLRPRTTSSDLLRRRMRQLSLSTVLRGT